MKIDRESLGGAEPFQAESERLAPAGRDHDRGVAALTRVADHEPLRHQVPPTLGQDLGTPVWR